jgi:hypothetical protein
MVMIEKSGTKLVVVFLEKPELKTKEDCFCSQLKFENQKFLLCDC